MRIKVWQTNASAVSSECTRDAVVAVNFSVGAQRIGGGVIPQLRVTNVLRLEARGDGAITADEAAGAASPVLAASPLRSAPGVRADGPLPARQTFTSRLEEPVQVPTRPVATSTSSPKRAPAAVAARSPAASPTRSGAELQGHVRAAPTQAKAATAVVTVDHDGGSDDDNEHDNDDDSDDVPPVRTSLKRRRN